MIKKLQSILIASVFVLGFAAPVATLAVAPASAQGSIQEGLDRGTRAVDPEGADADAEDRVNQIITTVINIFSLVVGVISVIMIIIGGLKYITSGGDSGNVTGAKNTILYAIIGLVVVALAQIIVRFVLTQVTD